MELDWSTFILEIVNFAILAWLLLHFFYRPVMNIIAARRQNIQESLNQAEKVKSEAEALASRYENRLADWEKERGAERTRLHGELEEERNRARLALEQELAKERDRAHTMIEREHATAVEDARRLARTDGLAFTALLLQRLAEPALESNLIQLAIEDMAALDPEQLATLRGAWTACEGEVQITSVWPIDAPARTSLADALKRVFGDPSEIEFRQDPSLVAGICIDVGSYKLDANLKAELDFFGTARQPDDGG